MEHGSRRSIGQLIDAHSHVFEPADLWTTYLEDKFKSRAIRIARTDSGIEHMAIDGRPSIYSMGMGPFAHGMGVPYEELISGASGFYDGREATYDPKARLKFMDEMGVAAAALLPTLGLIWANEVKDVELNAAYSRAYHRWLVDFCSTDTSRLLGIAQVPLFDIDEAVREIELLRKAGMRGLLVFAAPQKGVGFWDKIYDPLWGALETLEMPLMFHPALNESFFGSQWIRPGNTDGTILDDRYLLYMESFAVVADVQSALSAMMQGGVFDRFPKLKVVLLETGVGWLGHILERHDTKYRRVGSRSPLKHPPSEYFRRQMWAAFDADETMLRPMVERFGAERFLWASDVFHWDVYPELLPPNRNVSSDLPEAARDQVLRRNAAALFGVDLQTAVSV